MITIAKIDEYLLTQEQKYPYATQTTQRETKGIILVQEFV